MLFSSTLLYAYHKTRDYIPISQSIEQLIYICMHIIRRVDRLAFQSRMMAFLCNLTYYQVIIPSNELLFLIICHDRLKLEYTNHQGNFDPLDERTWYFNAIDIYSGYSLQRLLLVDVVPLVNIFLSWQFYCFGVVYKISLIKLWPGEEEGERGLASLLDINLKLRGEVLDLEMLTSMFFSTWQLWKR